MQDVVWDRAAAIQRLRHDVWRYITRASRDDDDALVNAAALLQMPVAHVRHLAHLQFVLSDEVGRLLHGMPALSRRLTTTSEPERMVSAERIQGPIRWGETFAERASTGVPHAFVTAPTRRAFDTPENRVLVFALDAVAEFGARTNWHRGDTAGPPAVVRARVDGAVRWRQARSLRDLPHAVPTPALQARVRARRSFRRYQHAMDVVDLHRRYVRRLERDALRAAVEQHALIARELSVLVELECLFAALRALREGGWRAAPDQLVRPPLVFHGRREGATVEVEADARGGSTEVRLDVDGLLPNRGYAEVRDEFMLGSRLLVAPVLTRGATRRTVLIPPGRWRARDGAVIRGPRQIEVAAPLDELPYFVRMYRR